MIKRIGVFGGSFDPIHCGHIEIAHAAVRECKLHKVIFLPALIPPHKGTLYASAYHRCAMLRLAIKRYPKFFISRYELIRRKSTYTRESISYFKRYYSRSRIFFLIGGDSMRDMRSWSGGYGLLDKCTFVVGVRPGGSFKNKFLRDKIIILRQKMPDVSATEVRQHLQRGKSIRGLVPEPVCRYIEKKKLYKKGKGTDPGSQSPSENQDCHAPFGRSQ